MTPGKTNKYGCCAAVAVVETVESQKRGWIKLGVPGSITGEISIQKIRGDRLQTGANKQKLLVGGGGVLGEPR